MTTEESAVKGESTEKSDTITSLANPVPALTMTDLVGTKGQQIKLLQLGEVLEGTILSKGKNEVYIDIPGYGLGVVRGRELYDDERILSKMKVGDIVFALVVEPENKEGNVELSFRKAGHERVWSGFKELLDKKEIVQTKILEANKGGLMVELNNVMGFLPVSQLSTQHYPRVEDGDKNKIFSILQSYVGQMFSVRVITADPEEEKLIVSEKAALEEQTKQKLSQLAMGTIVDGVITGVVDFGVFVKFGEELEGLVHISELAWQRIDDPKNLFKVGDQVRAQIISLDNDRISLSVKRLSRDPWEDVVKKYQVGQVVVGRVTKIVPFGAFVELDDDIHGLAHLGELSPNPISDPKEAVTEGEEHSFKIISIEPENHRLGLSLRAVNEDAAGQKKKAEDEGVAPVQEESPEEVKGEAEASVAEVQTIEEQK
ncbi:MAG: S1 RNA-binding domain-containing protein [bacterium]|nr:S1 RNA-binding domain-containing protein [bacterium]